MKHALSAAVIIALGITIGALLRDKTSTANAQCAPASSQLGDALWQLTEFGDSRWCLNVNNERVRACNMVKVSVADERLGPHHGQYKNLQFDTRGMKSAIYPSTTGGLHDNHRSNGSTDYQLAKHQKHTR